ncbi:hypothetical protein BKD26_35160 [Streptomyces sp. CB03238]|nr:hypothetical protein BKD26_35160 [Streptomyces sp. CB03238]
MWGAFPSESRWGLFAYMYAGRVSEPARCPVTVGTGCGHVKVWTMAPARPALEARQAGYGPSVGNAGTASDVLPYEHEEER